MLHCTLHMVSVQAGNRSQTALTWQVLADDVCGLHSTGHGGMDDFVKLQPQAGKAEASEFRLFPTLKGKHISTIKDSNSASCGGST